MKTFLFLLLIPSLALAAPHAYVTNQRAGTVTILDTATHKPVGTIKVGAGPRGIAIGPDGRIYVAVSDTARTAQGAAESRHLHA